MPKTNWAASKQILGKKPTSNTQSPFRNHGNNKGKRNPTGTNPGKLPSRLSIYIPDLPAGYYRK
jgi:hypothetical protein